MANRCSRSELGSITSEDNQDIILKKYLKYKELCKDLIEENEELKQNNSTLDRKYEVAQITIKEFENESILLTKKIQDLEQSMEIQIKDLTDQIKTFKTIIIDLEAKINIQNDIVTDLKKNLVEKEQNVKDYIEKCETQFSKIELENDVFVHICSSWWCPKHSSLKHDIQFLVPNTLEEKKSLQLAMARQKYWITDSKVRCCVLDRKTGVDKHTLTPKCYTKYLNDRFTQNKNCESSEENSPTRSSGKNNNTLKNRRELFQVSDDEEI